MTKEEMLKIIADFYGTGAYETLGVDHDYSPDWIEAIESNPDYIAKHHMSKLLAFRMAVEVNRDFSECRKIIERLGVK